MKFTLIFLFFCAIGANAKGLAQQVNLKLKNAPMEKVLSEITEQTGFRFLYSKETIAELPLVTVQIDHMDIDDALREILSERQLEFKRIARTITISKRKKPANPVVTPQNRVIRGVVRDSVNLLPSVSVSIKGNDNLRTITDEQGRYSLSVPENATLVFRLIGYQTAERAIGDAETINVTLRVSTSKLEDVVVVGYGTTKRKDLTGSVATVNMEDMMEAPVASFDEALAGRVAGVQVSADEGQPGSAMKIVIRGQNSITQSNDPLYVVDGFPMEDFESSGVNPEDIESMTVLKDASATAIYGARGANGVIVIETKKGTISRPSVYYSGYVGTQDILKTMDLMTPYEFVKYQIERNASSAATSYLNNGKTLDSYKNVKGYDWQDQMFRTALKSSHTLSVRGGTAQTKYAFSGSLYNQDGIIINSSFDRIQGRMTVDQTISKKVSASLNLSYSDVVVNGTSPAANASQSSNYLMYSVWGYRPITGSNISLDEDLNDPEIDNAFDYRINPIVSTKNDHLVRKTRSFTPNLNIVYDINKNFTFNVRGGLSLRNYVDETFYNSNTRRGSPRPNNVRGINGSIIHRERMSWVNENTLTYRKAFNKVHKLNLLGGFTMQAYDYNRYGYSVMQIPNEDLGMSGIEQGTLDVGYAEKSRSTLASFLARAEYDYKSKYLFTASLRADGSSKLAEGNRWSYFPSGAFAWRMSEESFMEALDFINDAKFRASYGVTGNNRVSDFSYRSSLSMPSAASYSFGGQLPDRGMIPSRLGNRQLKWENTSQIDLGYDLSLFKGKVEFTADVYRKTTYDLLLNANIPYTTGYATAFKNIGKVQNQGLELTLNTINIKNEAFSWTSSFNISFNNNKVLELAETEDNMLTPMVWDSGYNGVPLYITEIGRPIAMFYGYISDGLYTLDDFDKAGEDVYVLKKNVPSNGSARSSIKPGHIKYKDLNSDGIIDQKDATILGDGVPKHTGGFSNNFRYKRFKLNVFFQWSYGNDVYNANRLMFEENVGNRMHLNQFASYEDRWTFENQDSTIPTVGGEADYGVYSSRVLEDASYVRLKTLSLAYSVPTEYVRKVGFKALSLSVAMQNIFTWTNYTGMDPEVAVRSTALTPGFDYSAYPHARTVTFKVSASF